jgi:hypothetical protein
MARTQKPITVETLQDEVRFLLKTLLRDDVFPDEVRLPEAEKLLDNSLSVGFVEHCAFLKRHGYLDVDRAKNTVVVLPRGRGFADGNADATLAPAIASHFAARLPTGVPATPPTASATTGPEARSPLPGALGGGGLGPGASPGNVFATGFAAAAPAARPPERARAGGLFAQPERYARGELLGHGSLGPVYAGRDATLERDVVIKEIRHVYELVTYVPRDEITARVKAAVMAQARLDHPHVLRIVDVQFGGDAPCVVLDRASESLAARLARGLMPIDAVLRVLLQTASGLASAHRQGVVHGGLKPDNVLFDAAGNVRIADFAIARVAERPVDALNTSAPPVYVGRGHPSYMAPEQLHKGKVGAAGDVYSLGILLYEMLTGNLPGRRSPMPSSSERVVRAIGAERVAALDDLFDRMTRDPLSERFTSMDAVLDALYAGFPADVVGARGTLLLSDHVPDASADVSAGVSAGVSADGSAEGSAEDAPVEVTAVTKAPAALREP